MYGSTYDYLRPAQFGTLLGLKVRRTAGILGELEALGFELLADEQGVRRIHPELAEAVRAARSEGRELSTLRDDPELYKFLPFSERGTELDPLGVLIGISAEVALVRAAVGVTSSGLKGIGSGDWQRIGWRAVGLPDPRSDL